jgi:polyisoprenoid-binding protein YceI
MSSALVETETAIERWTTDPGRTTIEFEVEHLWGLHAVRGRFQSFSGVYAVDQSGSSIELTIDAASVDTGCAARDRHLRSRDFLHAEQHPQVRFTSTRITGIGSGRVRVAGELEAAGRGVPLAFDASVRLVDADLEFEATATVDQSRFGMVEGPLGNVRRPMTVRVKTRLVRVPSGFDAESGGSGGAARGSGLAATRETVEIVNLNERRSNG